MQRKYFQFVLYFIIYFSLHRWLSFQGKDHFLSIFQHKQFQSSKCHFWNCIYVHSTIQENSTNFFFVFDWKLAILKLNVWMIWYYYILFLLLSMEVLQLLFFDKFYWDQIFLKIPYLWSHILFHCLYFLTKYFLLLNLCVVFLWFKIMIKWNPKYLLKNFFELTYE